MVIVDEDPSDPTIIGWASRGKPIECRQPLTANIF